MPPITIDHLNYESHLIQMLHCMFNDRWLRIGLAIGIMEFVQTVKNLNVANPELNLVSSLLLTLRRRNQVLGSTECLKTWVVVPKI
jgi:hypothetical protein